MARSTSTQGRLLAFEGVDGAGKSTVIHQVAQACRARGESVFLPRTGKEHDSRPAREIRRLTRDRRNLELCARAELHLYCAREAQVLEQTVRPALERGQTVLLDRSLLTPVVLAASGRGLPLEESERTAALAANGLEPAVTFVFDVHPRTSRIRKRLQKVRERGLGTGGRKGLAGSGFKERVREGYADIAERRGYPLLHVERIAPTELARRVLAVLEGASPTELESPEDRIPQWTVDPELDFQAALERVPESVALFLTNGLMAGRELRRRSQQSEPEIAAWALDPEDPSRESFLPEHADYALGGLVGKPLDGEGDLRLRWLAKCPDAAIRALRYQADETSDAARARYASSCPGAVVESLAGREDAIAERLREACWREATPEERSTSLVGCPSEVAWRRRLKLLEKAPVAAIDSLRGVQDAEADRILDAFVELAPKTVLRALAGRSDRTAHALRERAFDCGREAIDSVRGLDDEISWALRERCLERWPSTVIHSLSGLEGPRVDRTLAQAAAFGAGDLHALRRIVGLHERASLPAWATARRVAGLDAGD